MTQVFDSPLALGDEHGSLAVRVRKGEPVLLVRNNGAIPQAAVYTLSESDMRDLHEWLGLRLRSTGALPKPTGDEWEQQARAAAMALPVTDYGSTRAILDVARLLREAHRKGYAEGSKAAEYDDTGAVGG